MADVLIRTPKDWDDFVRLKIQDKVPSRDKFFVEHELAAEFSVFLMQRSVWKGITIGVVGTLFFVVMLVTVVRLVT